MATTTLSEDMALRIGLAARTLSDTHPSRLLRALAEVVGLPPNPERLAALKVKDLKQAGDGEFGQLDQAELKAALAILKGEVVEHSDPPPAIEAYAEGDMPDSIRVACASDHGEELDGHFGTVRRFLVYQVSASETRLIDVRAVDESQAGDDRNAYRAGLIADCQVLYVASIGGPAAAKVVKRDIHPIKDALGGSIRERLQALQGILAGKAPPWLAKVMGHAPEARVRFERDEAEA